MKPDTPYRIRHNENREYHQHLYLSMKQALYKTTRLCYNVSYGNIYQVYFIKNGVNHHQFSPFVKSGRDRYTLTEH